MTGFLADPTRDHLAAVDLLAAAGIDPPADWAALRQRSTDDTTETCQDRLTRAVLDGDRTADMTALRAGALAESLATPQARAQVNNALRAAVGRRLRDLYQPHAAANYEQLADRFDAAAAEFTTAAALIDPETDAAAIVSAAAKVRAAWTDAELAALKLDALMPALAAAAQLCGISTTRPEALLALVCDPADHHRRQVWEAFNTSGGRGGRWAALTAAGISIRAHRPIATLEPYRTPQPLEERWEQTDRGMHQRRMVDPEDLHHPAQA